MTVTVQPGSTDLRKGTSGLLAIIENEMNLNALDNSIFMFCNKNHKLIKVIFWDKTGFWVAQKRLEKSTWPWPKTNEKAKEINTEQIEMLLKGIDFGKPMKNKNIQKFSKKI